jgi:hypothetical protein
MANFKLGKIQYGFVEITTASGTTTLVANSKQKQIFLGSAPQTLVLPAANTMQGGIPFVVVNSSTGVITVQDNGLNTLATVAAGSTEEFFLTSNATANGTWRTFSAGSPGASGLGSFGPGTALTAARGIFGGGDTGSQSSIIDYVVITNRSNAISFGSLTIARYYLGGCASSTRGVFGGSSASAVMDYITIATTGNAISFGTMSVTKGSYGSCSSSSRGLFGGGSGGSSTIEYITIATTGNGTSFGNLSVARDTGLGSFSSPVRGIFAGGSTGSDSAIIDYVTIATTGNAVNFGNLTVARRGLRGCSNSVTGVNAGGTTPYSTIDYVTIATLGNATSFGNLTTAREYIGGASSPTLGLFGGGSTGSMSSIIDYISFATIGNAVSFSNAHGGL